MEEPQKSGTGDQPVPKRRETDHGQGAVFNDLGGGRRDSDRRSILPRSKFGLLAVGLSYLFSITLLAIAFTSPFRRMERKENDSVKATDVKLEYEARIPSEQYVDYAMGLNDDLKDQIRRKNDGSDRELPDRHEVVENWKKRLESHRTIVESIRKEAGEHEIVPGSIQWEYLKELEKVAEDAPVSE
ncbi:hypothetical protein [Rhodopirellula sp. MGV]|uniref:hypothetical protein n=1 Tax=Rhodopirellula sp. MGV TaxID=2023130 RepID=UPI000B9796A1|nr:hypothetical protein [Rhodopirellula sp. MGV]OYP34047.1 hypothetical protein CGZ80_16700 [Rhodopirellula sp. MGV]PNY38325.1 hypothetical protein C2E31_03150 [Rhodopirellula baltica]